MAFLTDKHFWNWARAVARADVKSRQIMALDDRIEFDLDCYYPVSAYDERSNFDHWRNGMPFISNPLEIWEENQVFREPEIDEAVWLRLIEQEKEQAERKRGQRLTMCRRCIGGRRWDEHQDEIVCSYCGGTGRR